MEQPIINSIKGNTIEFFREYLRLLCWIRCCKGLEGYIKAELSKNRKGLTLTVQGIQNIKKTGYQLYD